MPKFLFSLVHANQPSKHLPLFAADLDRPKSKLINLASTKALHSLFGASGNSIVASCSSSSKLLLLPPLLLSREAIPPLKMNQRGEGFKDCACFKCQCLSWGSSDSFQALRDFTTVAPISLDVALFPRVIITIAFPITILWMTLKSSQTLLMIIWNFESPYQHMSDGYCFRWKPSSCRYHNLY